MSLGGVYIEQGRCFELASTLGRMATVANQATGYPVPELVADLLEELRRAAEHGSATFRQDTERNPAEAPGLPVLTWLTVAEAAQRAEVSESYMRRVIREGALDAARGHRRAWLIDTDTLNAWQASRTNPRQPRTA